MGPKVSEGVAAMSRPTSRFYIACSVFCLFFCSNTIGQRNLIDVPSGEIVEEKKIFVQQQAVIMKTGVNASSILTYGVGNNFEAGITIHQLVFKKSEGLEIDPESEEDNPDLLINLQQGFDVKDWLKLSIGSRSGFSAARSIADIRFVTFDYFTAQFLIGEHKLIAGPYYANSQYAGEGANVGAIGGVDLSVVKEKIDLIADFLTGDNAVSVINAGLQLSLPREWKLAIGAQFPMPDTANENGVLFQISKN
jgi:hypothetical protein